jgi:hypothetical protein
MVRRLFVGVLLLLCSLTFYYFAVLKIDYKKTFLLDLNPGPDAAEYFAQAKAISKGKWPSIQIGYDELPSRYPFGYPALMLPWLKILPRAGSILAPFRTNQTVGLLFLLGVFSFYLYLEIPLPGGFASLLVATLPGFFTFCRSSMSEISATTVIVMAFMFAYIGAKEDRRWKIYLSAVFLGLSLNVRMQCIYFAPLLLVMALSPVKGTRLRWFLHCAATCVVFALAASPILLMNTIQFHTPFKTGYDFWVPSVSENHLPFSLRYVPGNAHSLWKELTLQPRPYQIANIFGTGTLFVPAFILLTCAGLFFLRLDRFIGCAFLAGLSSFAATLCYRHGGDGRFYLPLLILLVPVAVLPITWAAKNLFAGKRIIVALTIFILFAAACLGYPSRSGYDTVAIDRSQAWDALDFRYLGRQSAWYGAQECFAERFGGQSGILLSDINPAYLNALLPDSFVAAPIDDVHDFEFSTIWHYGTREALALVEQGMDRGLPIYALVPGWDIATQNSRLPTPPGYEWTISNQCSEHALVLQLTPASSGNIESTESITINGETFTKSAVLERLKLVMTVEGYLKAKSSIQAAFDATARRDNPSVLAAVKSVCRRDYFVNGDFGTKGENCVEKCRDDPEPLYCILKCNGY